MNEQTALEAIQDVLRLEQELEHALDQVEALQQQIDVQRQHLAWLNGVRVEAQRETEHWREQYQAERDEMIRYTRGQMS